MRLLICLAPLRNLLRWQGEDRGLLHVWQLFATIKSQQALGNIWSIVSLTNCTTQSQQQQQQQQLIFINAVRVVVCSHRELQVLLPTVVSCHTNLSSPYPFYLLPPATTTSSSARDSTHATASVTGYSQRCKQSDYTCPLFRLWECAACAKVALD